MTSRTVGLDILIRVLNQASAPIRTIIHDMGSFARVVKDAAKSSQGAFDFAAKAREAGEAVNAFAMKARAALEAPIQTATDFQHALNVVGSKIVGTTPEELAQLSALFQHLGQTTQYSAIQAAEGASQLATAGFDVQGVLSALPQMLALAASDEMDLNDATRIAAKTLQSFHMDASQMADVVDILGMAANKSVTSVSAMGETLQYVASVAYSSGASLKEAAAMMWSMSAAVDASMAGTTIKNMYLNLQAPAREAKKAMAELDFNPIDKATGKLRPMVDIMEELSQKTKGMGAHAQELMKALFGQRAVTGALELMSRAADGSFRKNLEALDNAKGFTMALADKMNDDAKGAQKKLQGAVDSLQITIGSVVLDSLKGFAEAVTKAVNAVNELARAHPWLTTAIVVTTAAVAALTTGLTALLFMASTLASGLGVLSVAMGSSASGATLLGNMLKWPIVQMRTLAAVTGVSAGMAVAAFGLLILAGAMLYNQWDNIRYLWNELSRDIGESRWIQAALVALTPLTAGLSFATLVLGLLTDGWDKLKQGASDALAWIEAKVDLLVEKLNKLRSAIGLGGSESSAGSAPAAPQTAMVPAPEWSAPMQWTPDAQAAWEDQVRRQWKDVEAKHDAFHFTLFGGGEEAPKPPPVPQAPAIPSVPSLPAPGQMPTVDQVRDLMKQAQEAMKTAQTSPAVNIEPGEPVQPIVGEPEVPAHRHRPRRRGAAAVAYRAEQAAPVRVELGKGELHITIDHECRPRVKMVKGGDHFDVTVDTGRAMGSL